MTQLLDSQVDTAAPARRGAARPGHDRGSARTAPAVIVLGGEANALSVLRELGRQGVATYLIGDPDTCVRFSRHCRWIPVPVSGSTEESWARFLLGPDAEGLRGAVLLSCSDAGIQVLLRHREQLQARYVLDDSEPRAQREMLDKLTTYRHAQAAGVTTPLFWEVSSREQVLALRPSLVFPLMMKPRLSHLFEARFGRKHVIVDTFDDLLAAYDSAADARLDVLLMEWIPGGDDRLCSYFTYLDERSRPLFHFTKRVIRRYPSGMGAACYHITDWIPDLIEPANRLFAHVGLRGVANVEFKQDPRDGRYKIIECNARFTASNALVSAAGAPIATFVYNRLTGRPLPKMDAFRSGMRLWDPARDWSAFLERRATGELAFGGWVRSVLRPQHTFPFFAWSDPMPGLARLTKPLRRMVRRRR